jgi:two-component system chemotaxis response regulator CheB
MSAALVGSPSSFLRMGLSQQLRARWQTLRTMEATTAAEAMRIVAESTIDVAIVDEALLTERTGANLAAALSLIAKRTILIATGGASRLAPSLRESFLVIDGEIEGVLNMGAISSALPHALDHLVTATNRRYTPSAVATTSRPIPMKPAEAILMAASTGGPTALATLLKRIGRSRLPIIIAQHMPADQTAGFARYLAIDTGLDVAECCSGDVPSAPVVTVLGGGTDYRLGRGRSGKLRLIRAKHEPNLIHPSADLLFASAAEAGIEALAVVLSGMGEDGARGSALVAARGGRVLVQEFGSCVVAGMPSATFAACPSATVASLRRIAEHLTRWTVADGCIIGS